MNRSLYPKEVLLLLFLTWIMFSGSSAALHMSSSSPPNSSSITTKLQLITHRMCPYAQKAWLALECSANLDYELREVSLYGGPKPDWFWQLNPAGTVPVLVYQDQVWPDSDLILQAIADGQVGNHDNDQSHQHPLLWKDDPQHKQKVQSWRRAIQDMLPVGKQAVLSGDTTKLATLLQTSLERRLLPSNNAPVTFYLTGDCITIADCHAFPFLWRLDQEFGLAATLRCPQLAAWVERCAQVPAFSTTIPQEWWWWW